MSQYLSLFGLKIVLREFSVKPSDIILKSDMQFSRFFPPEWIIFFVDHPLSSEVISFLNGERVNFNEVVQSFWNNDVWMFDCGDRNAGCNSPFVRLNRTHLYWNQENTLCIFVISVLVKFLPQEGRQPCYIYASVFVW